MPSRLQPGTFYALPQSPQLFKQLCMVGGIDRYYQIARCLRDEDLRADRQFEFMQLDAEASFVAQDDVLGVHLRGGRRGHRGDHRRAARATIPRMTWHEAQERFGTDKPDVRFGMELVELTDVFAATEFNAFKAPCVKGIRVAGGADFTRNRLDDLTDQAKRWGAKGLVWMRVDGDDGELDSPVAKFLSRDRAGRRSARRWRPRPATSCCSWPTSGRQVRHVLGLLRLELGRPPVNEGGFHFLWVVEFPLFEAIDERRPADPGPPPVHHAPRRRPRPARRADPLTRARRQAYDLVLNGWELGSGSVRIHRADIQQRIFSLLGIDARGGAARFGFLLDAFRYGAPPHAGFAFGIDRLVALLAGEENIREVIAFPKTQSGLDPLTGAPTPVAGQGSWPTSAFGCCRRDRRPEPCMVRSPARRKVEPGRPGRSVREQPGGPPRGARRRWRPACGRARSTRSSARSTCSAPGQPLRALIEADRLSSVILWGPPGTGKTTLARLIADAHQQGLRAAVAR